MFDRNAYLHSRLDQITRQLGENKQSRTDVCDFDSISITRFAGTVSVSEATTMMKFYPQRALAMPIPTPDSHALRMERVQLLEELHAIESQDYPDASHWKNREYSVNGKTRRLG